MGQHAASAGGAASIRGSSGLVYLMYEDWRIYAVDPATLACSDTGYEPGQHGLGVENGITVAPTPAGERMLVAGIAHQRQVLDVGDLGAFVLSEVGPLEPQASSFPVDLRADAFGRIFGLAADGTFIEIDPATAALVAEDHTGFGSAGATWALLTWNEDICFFSGGAVSRYDLASKQLTPVGTVGVEVVGASAAPCLH